MELSTLNKISLEEMRKIDPRLIIIPDKELEKIRDGLYKMGALALECYIESKQSK